MSDKSREEFEKWFPRAWLDYTCDLHEDKSTIAIKRSKKKEGRG